MGTRKRSAGCRTSAANQERGRPSDGPFDPKTGKGHVKEKKGDYHDALYNKKKAQGYKGKELQFWAPMNPDGYWAQEAHKRGELSPYELRQQEEAQKAHTEAWRPSRRPRRPRRRQICLEGSPERLDQRAGGRRRRSGRCRRMYRRRNRHPKRDAEQTQR